MEVCKVRVDKRFVKSAWGGGEDNDDGNLSEVEAKHAFYDGFYKDCPFHFKEETLSSLELGADQE